MIRSEAHPAARERVLVIGGDEGFRARIRERYPDWEVTVARSALAGISDLCRRPSRAVLAYVGPPGAGARCIEREVAGLREAAGVETPLILCCPPEAEPLARRGLSAGACDYLVCPLEGSELDDALGYARVNREQVARQEAAPSATMDELTGLGELLGGLEEDGRMFLTRLAEVIRAAMGNAGVRVVVEGTVVEAGEVGSDPVLVEPIQSEGTLLGQVSLGLRQGSPYNRADADKLRHYAELAGRLLKAAGSQRRWRQLALTDELSGLPNRRALLRLLSDILDRAERARFCATVVLFDIDDFKRYNDTCGHDAGDEIIRVVSRLIKKHCREHDVVARYGGDEFAVVFWDAEQPRVAGSKHPDDALVVLRRFTQALSAHEVASLKQCGPYHLTISGGLASFPWDGQTAEDLIARADQALLQAKKAGKNRIFRIGEGKQP